MGWMHWVVRLCCSQVCIANFFLFFDRLIGDPSWCLPKRDCLGEKQVCVSWSVTTVWLRGQFSQRGAKRRRRSIGAPTHPKRWEINLLSGGRWRKYGASLFGGNLKPILSITNTFWMKTLAIIWLWSLWLCYRVMKKYSSLNCTYDGVHLKIAN